MRRYQTMGLLIALSSAILSLTTYVTLGLHPIIALWIGLTVVGLSIFITPAESLTPKHLVAFVNNALANMAMVLESLGLGSKTIYASYGDQVYIYVMDKLVEKLPETPPHRMFMEIDGVPVIVFRSPIHASIVEGYSEPCPAIDYVLTDLFDSADSVTCIEEGDTITISISSPRLSSPGKLERTVGSIYGIIAASIASLIRRKPYIIEYDKVIGGDRRIVLRVPGVG